MERNRCTELREASWSLTEAVEQNTATDTLADAWKARLPERLLLGAGPSVVPPPIYEAMARPTIGHMDPIFGQIMEEVAALLRETFRTMNQATLPVSATGSGGMETMIANLIEPGDRVICGVIGVFGERIADALRRQGAEVLCVEGEWGRALDLERLFEVGSEDYDAMVLVHGETSTGVAQPLDGLADLCRERDALLLVDCVTSLAGHPLEIDAAGVDAAFSGSQKCLNCPPGLAPFTIGERAIERITRSPRSWYFDLSAVLSYWSEGDTNRVYHHTAPINMIYALRAALELIHDEGLEQRWRRHTRAHTALAGALAELGLERLSPEGEALHPLLAVRVPAHLDEAAVRGALLEEDGIEISGGLGRLAGRIWRIGVMGAGAQHEVQERLVTTLARHIRVSPISALSALEDGWAL
jgi:alanine-glyoxylate transaminase/serine-glyoxylate transaminase/serine-pyruvate transaminase